MPYQPTTTNQTRHMDTPNYTMYTSLCIRSLIVESKGSQLIIVTYVDDPKSSSITELILHPAEAPAYLFHRPYTHKLSVNHSQYPCNMIACVHEHPRMWHDTVNFQVTI
ncbi:hypothetical protein ACB094_11G061200 [Castanea mollissima]